MPSKTVVGGKESDWLNKLVAHSQAVTLCYFLFILHGACACRYRLPSRNRERNNQVRKERGGSRFVLNVSL